MTAKELTRMTDGKRRGPKNCHLIYAGQIGDSDAFAFGQGGFELWNIHLGFGREPGGDGRKGMGFVTGEEMLKARFPAVVGGERQTPVLETPVQVANIAGRGARAFVRVKSFIGW